MILVVEDEPGIVDFVERGLRSDGFEVSSANDGQTGLTRALEPEVELVVLDLMLPLLSGAELLTRLHAARPELPVIVLTARGEVEDRIAGLDAGAVDYLVKPFSVAELAARIRAQLRSRQNGTDHDHDRVAADRPARPARVGAGAGGAALLDRVRAAGASGAEPPERAQPRSDPARRLGL